MRHLYLLLVFTFFVASATGNTDKESVLPPSTPSAYNATSYSVGSTTSFQANWSNAAGASTFRIDVSTSSGFFGFVTNSFNVTYSNVTVGNTAVTVNGLTNGNVYYYRVRAVDGLGVASSNSNTITVYPAPPAPIAAAATAGTPSSFTANWSNVTFAESYRIDVSTTNFSTFVAGYNNLTVSGTSVMVTGLSPGTTYTYRIRSFNSTATSANSTVISATTPPVPPSINIPSNITSTSFNANWVGVSGASGYLLDVSIYPVFTSFIPGYQDKPVSTTTFNIIGLTPATQYYYRVRATNTLGNSNYSGYESGTTILDPPATPTASSVTANSFIVNWTNVSGAESYLLDVSSTSAFNVGDYVPGFMSLSVTPTTQSVTGLSAGSYYYFRVRAVKGSITSYPSTTANKITVPAAPTIANPSNVLATSFQANWSGGAGASGFKLDVTSSPTGDFTSGLMFNYGDRSVATTTELVSPTTNSNIYYYRVRAVNASGASSNSASAVVYPPPPPPTALAATSPTTTSFVANWSSVQVATEYRLDVSSDNFTTYILNKAPVTGTNSLVSGLTAGTTYSYRVWSYNPTATSTTSSNTITLPTIPSIPTTTAATAITSSSFTANWGGITGATGYLLDVSLYPVFTSYISGYQAKVLGAVTNASITGLSPATQYYYRVRASNTSGASDYPTSGTSVTTILDPPGLPTASNPTATTFTANWIAVNGATSYLLDVATVNSFASGIVVNGQAVTGLSQAVSGLTAATTYYFRVRAVKGSVISLPSATANKITVPDAPTILNANNVTATSFQANWSGGAGASGFKLDVSTSSDFSGFLNNYFDRSVATTTELVSPTTSSNIYYYRVRAVNASGPSANSTTKTVYPPPPAPIIQGATDVTSSSFTARWSSVAVATSYKLEVSPDAGFSTYQTFNPTSPFASVATLSANQTYYYRVRAENSTAVSSFVGPISVTTLATAPSISNATFVAGRSFIANWNSPNDVTSFKLDVSLSNTFATFIEGHQDKVVFSKSSIVSGLTEGTNYYYRVRSVLAGVASDYSTTAPVTTLGQQGQMNENFVRSNTVLVVNKTDVNAVDNLPIAERSQSVQYMDGLGRAKQTVLTQGSPAFSDVVTPIVYDQYGREVRKYLPFVSGNDGKYVNNNTIIDQATGNYTGVAQTFHVTSNKLSNISSHQYSQTNFEPSPLNRIREQGAPGQEWQPSTGHGIKKIYRANLVQEVLKFNYDVNTGYATLSSVATERHFNANELLANVSYDEQDNEVIEFIDKEGKTICKKVKSGVSQYAETYYIYDKFGSLVVVLSPQAVLLLTTPQN